MQDVKILSAGSFFVLSEKGETGSKRYISFSENRILMLLHNSVHTPKCCGKVWKTNLTFPELWKTFF